MAKYTVKVRFDYGEALGRRRADPRGTASTTAIIRLEARDAQDAYNRVARQLSEDANLDEMAALKADILAVEREDGTPEP